MDKYIVYFKNTGIALYLVIDFTNDTFVFTTKKEYASQFRSFQDAYNWVIKYISEAEGIVITNKIKLDKPNIPIRPEWKNYKKEFLFVKKIKVNLNNTITPYFYIPQKVNPIDFMEEFELFFMKNKLQNNQNARGVIVHSNPISENGMISFSYQYRNETFYIYNNNGVRSKKQNIYEFLRFIQENYFYEPIMNFTKI